MDELAKMTILPARRLEPFAPEMKNKGRIRMGGDADVIVFDRKQILDTATLEKGLSFPAGIDPVPVDGVAAVRNGAGQYRPVSPRHQTLFLSFAGALLR